MSAPLSPANPDEIEWNLIDSARTLIRRRRTLFLWSMIGLISGVAIAAWLKPVYTAQAIFLPPKEPDAQTGPAIIFGETSSSDIYLGMLSSRTVADDVIDHVGLMSIYKAKMHDEARILLSNSSRFTVNKGSFIVVRVTSGDPTLAAKIANAYLEALYRLNGSMADSTSDHRSAYLESQLESARIELAQAEQALKTTQQRTGVVLPTGEAQAGLSATAQLQSQIEAAETRLAGLLVSETDQNSQVIELRSELKQLRAQLAQQQSQVGHRAGLASTADLPELTLENAQKERELHMRETIFDSIVQQYEKARFAATDPGPLLQIVDRAEIPERKSGPPRKLIALGGMLIGFALSFLWMILARPVRRVVLSLREPAPVPQGPLP
jgi:tyrosine-protein kinase Etk/Wzc